MSLSEKLAKENNKKQNKQKDTDPKKDSFDSSLITEAVNSHATPLDSQDQKYMKDKLDFNFSNVKIHTNEVAAQSAAALNAKAYTIGQDIIFSAGQYNPKTSTGKQLLTHELVHVMQQQQLTHRPTNSEGLKIGSHECSSEQEAKKISSSSDEFYHVQEQIPCDEIHCELTPWEIKSAQEAALTKTSLARLERKRVARNKVKIMCMHGYNEKDSPFISPETKMFLMETASIFLSFEYDKMPDGAGLNFATRMAMLPDVEYIRENPRDAPIIYQQLFTIIDRLKNEISETKMNNYDQRKLLKELENKDLTAFNKHDLQIDQKKDNGIFKRGIRFIGLDKAAYNPNIEEMFELANEVQDAFEKISMICDWGIYFETDSDAIKQLEAGKEIFDQMADAIGKALGIINTGKNIKKKIEIISNLVGRVDDLLKDETYATDEDRSNALAKKFDNLFGAIGGLEEFIPKGLWKELMVFFKYFKSHKFFEQNTRNILHSIHKLNRIEQQNN